jgi:hypothetical protein
VALSARSCLPLIAAVAVVAAGCGQHTSTPPPPVTGNEWRAVVSDWSMHGRFAQRHPCAAVVVARSRAVPAYREGTSLVHALDMYERKLCSAGDVWAVQTGMTDREVVSLAGAPIPWRSGPHCWQYHASKPGTSIDGLAFCFDRRGRVAAIKTGVHG